MEDHHNRGDWLTFVGVVDVSQAIPGRLQPYLKVGQLFFLSHMTFAVRTASDPAAV